METVQPYPMGRGKDYPHFRIDAQSNWVFPCLLRLLPTHLATYWPPLWAFEIQVKIRIAHGKHAIQVSIQRHYERNNNYPVSQD